MPWIKESIPQEEFDGVKYYFHSRYKTSMPLESFREAPVL
jgi:hypothetical protein